MAKKTPLKLWISGARLRTLPLAIAPVALGSGVASENQSFNLGLALLALTVALGLQIGVNYSNDYSDGVRGTDDFRVGPMRLTGSQQVAPEKVKRAAFISFGIAAAAGLAITALTANWWLLAVGALAIVAAWYYTGGKRPYGYVGLGEIVVFIFFGLVATIGTAFIQIGSFAGDSLIGGIGLGCLASAVLLINNIRDIETDKPAGKRTIAVLLGKRAATALYLALLWLPQLILIPFFLLYPATFMAYASLFLVIPASLVALTHRKPGELITALKLTSYAGLTYGVLLGWGLAVVNFG
jgi:1,4-dihydroxy-2-naphthoate octaprenyltransferase